VTSVLLPMLLRSSGPEEEQEKMQRSAGWMYVWSSFCTKNDWIAFFLLSLEKIYSGWLWSRYLRLWKILFFLVSSNRSFRGQQFKLASDGSRTSKM